MIELIITIGMILLCINIVITGFEGINKKTSEFYAKELIRDIYYYFEKAYITKEKYLFEFEEKGYIISNDSDNIVKRISYDYDIYNINYKSIKCIRCNENKKIINNVGSIKIGDKKDNKVVEITIVPTSGRLRLKKN